MNHNCKHLIFYVRMKLKSKLKINLHINIQITQNTNQLLPMEAKELFIV